MRCSIDRSHSPILRTLDSESERRGPWGGHNRLRDDTDTFTRPHVTLQLPSSASGRRILGVDIALDAEDPMKGKDERQLRCPPNAGLYIPNPLGCYKSV